MLINLNQISYDLRHKRYPRFIKKLLYSILIRLNRINIDEEMWDTVLQVNNSKDVITFACCSGHKSIKSGYVACQYLGGDTQFEALTYELSYILSKSGAPFIVEYGPKLVLTSNKGIRLFLCSDTKEFTIYWESSVEKKPCLAALDTVLKLIQS